MLLLVLLLVCLAAELWAIREGINCAVQGRIRKLIIDSDAQVAVDLIKREGSDSHSLSAIIRDCRWLMQQLEEVQLNHAHRQSNACADILAKKGCNCNSNSLLCTKKSPMDCIVPQLNADDISDFL